MMKFPVPGPWCLGSQGSLVPRFPLDPRDASVAEPEQNVMQLNAEYSGFAFCGIVWIPAGYETH